MSKALVTTLAAALATTAGVALTASAPASSSADPPAPAPATARSGSPEEPGTERTWGAEASPLMRPDDAIEYWTVSKQSRANAVDLPLGQAAGEAAGEAGPRIAGPRIAGGAAGGAAERRLSVPQAKRITPGADVNGYSRVSRPYTRAAASRITGRLFFVNADGQRASCSASVVRSARGLLVATAAHCVYGVPKRGGQPQWYRNFAFVPGYDGRARTAAQREPYGRWGGRRVWKPDGYTAVRGGDWNSIYDLALIEVGRKGTTLQRTVGAFTPMRNQGGSFTVAAYGYPGNDGGRPYTGADQLWCLGRTKQTVGAVGRDIMVSAPAPAA
ncbi:hypothetical protein HII36_30965, partial [Nonomuraea sp. NN258]|uniref:trypsin-like serine peptidase n=1 Tax=Nonomuraea antri TaxID=2730852 RepID=UPI001569D7C0